jgi:DNA-binding transcriptional ArsR family regulator
MTNAGTPRWSKIPTAWIRYDAGLMAFTIRDVGGSAAALKIYISIALLAAYRTKAPTLYAGQATVSYDEFELITGLSRSLIPRGIEILKSAGMIEVIESARIHAYRLVGYDDDSRGWGKLPYDHLRSGPSGGRLAAVGHRYQGDLNALKIYLALVAFRDGASGYSSLSYDKIVEYTGVHRSRVRPALSSLYETRLVAVDPTTDLREKLNAPRRYVVEGLARQRLADEGMSVPGSPEALRSRPLGATWREAK